MGILSPPALPSRFNRGGLASTLPAANPALTGVTWTYSDVGSATYSGRVDRCDGTQWVMIVPPSGTYVTSRFRQFVEDPARVGPDIGCHQGYATDGTNHFGIDTGTIKKFDATWNPLTTNATPFAGLSNVSHLGDGACYNGKLYIAANENAVGISADHDSLLVFNTSDLSLSASRLVAGDLGSVSNIGGVGVLPDLGLIVGVSYADGSHFWFWNLADLSFHSSVQLDVLMSSVQGVSYFDGIVYVSSGLGAVYGFTPAGKCLGALVDRQSQRSNAWAYEGVDVTTGEIRRLIDKGAGDRKVHFFTTEVDGSFTVGDHGQVTVGSAAGTPPGARLVVPGYGRSSGYQFGEDASTAAFLFRGDNNSLTMEGRLDVLKGHGSSIGTVVQLLSYTSLLSVNQSPDASWAADQLHLGAQGAASRDFNIKRYGVGKGGSDNQFQALDGLATKDVGAVDGKSSADIDALFTAVPVDGQTATGTMDGYPVFLTRRNGTWSFVSLMGPTGRVLSAVASADVVRTTTDGNTPLADADLHVTMAKNATYELGGFIIYDTSTAADFKGGWTLPAGATGDWNFRGASTSGSTDPGSIIEAWAAIGSNESVGGVGVGTIIVAQLVGRVVTGATAGDLTFNWSQATLDATNTTRRAGSLLRLLRLT